MHDIIITGASRGIGRALATEVASQRAPGRLFLLARDAPALDALATTLRARGADVHVLAGDLGSLATARRLGEELAGRVTAGATLVHNAGIWPSRLELTEEGLERSFAVNCAGPLRCRVLRQAILG